MKNFIAAAVLLMFAATPAFAQRKPCEELLTEIDAKIQAKGIKKFSLEIVPNEKAADVKDGKVVGTCDGGTKKIVYKLGK
ncbi:MAG: DUF1161 domain-containing protein [Thermodesulfovibrionales bacterium]|nr:DUF1161 domain-containing protein [Thermodesulfovibrionales bacterium]